MTRQPDEHGDGKERDRAAHWAELDALDDLELGLRVEAELDRHDWAMALKAAELSGEPAREVAAPEPALPGRRSSPRRFPGWRSRGWLPLAAALILAMGLGALAWHGPLPWAATAGSGSELSDDDAAVVWRDAPSLDPTDGSQLGLEFTSPAPGELRWTPIDDAVLYRLEVLDSRGLLLLSRVLDAERPTVVHLDADAADLSGAAYARLRAKLTDGREYASEIIDFQSR